MRTILNDKDFKVGRAMVTMMMILVVTMMMMMMMVMMMMMMVMVLITMTVIAVTFMTRRFDSEDIQDMNLQ